MAVDKTGFPLNPWGPAHVHGNVREWVQDIWSGSYSGLPTDGSANMNVGNLSFRVVRGGSMDVDGSFSRSAKRVAGQTVERA